MNRFSILLVSILILAISPMLLAIPTYTGSLSTPDGIDGTVPWSEDFTISWEITDMGSYWCYNYTLASVTGGFLGKDPSHLIIEFSEIATDDNWWDAYLENYELLGDLADLDWYSGDDPSNPLMPGPMYGLKLNTPDDFPEDWGAYHYTFYSDKTPVWGDFYVKDGIDAEGSVAAWNTDFLMDDPLAPAQNGLLSDGQGGYIYKILRPDSVPEIPEPATLSLLGLGLLGSGLFARRRR